MTTTDDLTDSTDVGPATPAPQWCLPGTEPSWDKLADGGGMICTWSRSFPANDPSADVWIQAEDRIVDGRVLRSTPQIVMYEVEAPGNIDPGRARQLAAALLDAAEVMEQLDD